MEASVTQKISRARSKSPVKSSKFGTVKAASLPLKSPRDDAALAMQKSSSASRNGRPKSVQPPGQVPGWSTVQLFKGPDESVPQSARSVGRGVTSKLGPRVPAKSPPPSPRKPSHMTASASTRTPSDARDNSIKVCMRIRPLSKSETARGEERIVMHASQSPKTLFLKVPGTVRTTGRFSDGNLSQHIFDWVLPEETPQSRIYELLGTSAVQGAMNGYHSCVFAYGQTGSGKSFSIFGGTHEERGLLPRIVEGLFAELESATQKAYMVRLSYLELYNETARDLLHPGNATGQTAPLEIHQHPKSGVFVKGLTLNVVENVNDVLQLLDFGNKMRVVGCTNMNAVSSRSHTVVTLDVEIAVAASKPGLKTKQCAHLHTVDLAGSERLNAERSETRLKESQNINKSLLALGIMISQLAAGNTHISCRESKLTLLLADSLMGNCMTTMLACISPAISTSTVTEATIRFANSVKKIHTKPVKNEEAEIVLIQTLYDEIESLKKELQEAQADKQKEIEERIAETLRGGVAEEAWTERIKSSHNFQRARTKTLHSLGLGKVIEREEEDHPYLLNHCDDPLLAGCLKYRLPPGEAIHMGSDDASCAIVISGLGVQSQMCSVLVSKDMRAVEVIVAPSDVLRQERCSSRRPSLFKSGTADVSVNGETVEERTSMQHGDHLQVGSTHVFKLVVPLVQAVDGLQGQEASANAVRSQGYMSHLQQRLGATKASGILSEVNDLQVLVKEANSIARELLGFEANHNIFKLHVLVDISAEKDDPRLVVAVHPSGNPAESVQREALWPVPKFRQRLEMMRDLYHAVSERDLPWGRPGDLMPWDDTDCTPVVEQPEPDKNPGAQPLHASGIPLASPGLTPQVPPDDFAQSATGRSSLLPSTSTVLTDQMEISDLPKYQRFLRADPSMGTASAHDKPLGERKSRPYATFASEGALARALPTFEPLQTNRRSVKL